MPADGSTPIQTTAGWCWTTRATSAEPEVSGVPDQPGMASVQNGQSVLWRQGGQGLRRQAAATRRPLSPGLRCSESIRS